MARSGRARRAPAMRFIRVGIGAASAGGGGSGGGAVAPPLVLPVRVYDRVYAPAYVYRLVVPAGSA